MCHDIVTIPEDELPNIKDLLFNQDHLDEIEESY
jgi:hypothetical protein